MTTKIATKQNAETENPSGPCDDQLISAEQMITLTPSSTSTPTKAVECDVSVSNINTSRYCDSTSVVSSPRKASGDLAFTRQVENTVCHHFLCFIAFNLDASTRTEVVQIIELLFSACTSCKQTMIVAFMILKSIFIAEGYGLVCWGMG